MAIQEEAYSYNMQITLEKHFERLAQNYPAAQEIHSLWVLLRKRLEDELVHSRGVFANYSIHDGSHSRSVIQAIERFLGEERICQLSATDTFMLLACTYAHDYGMAQTFNRIYDILGSSGFKDFLEEMNKNSEFLENEDRWAVKNLLRYMNEEKKHIALNDMYFSIMLVIQLYLRPNHWRGVSDIRKDFEGLFSGQIKKRFIDGSEGIVEICMCHGQPIEELFKLSKEADGMVGDDYHPRFVAAMLRLGDLLDLDNGRFSMSFIREIAKNKNIIPELSIMHFKKHEAISHLLITPKKIEITAQCHSRIVELKPEEEYRKDVEIEKAQKECLQIAGLVDEWTQSLKKECKELVMQWAVIAQPNFGNPPANLKVNIYVDGEEYRVEDRMLQMRMPQERVMKLLEGTSIYRDEYVGIREMVQNAIDASLLQLWSDLLQNRYSYCGLSKDEVLKGLDLLDFLDEKKASIFGNYDIVVEVIEDRLREQVIVVVKDKGIGITPEEARYIADIGSSKEKNTRVRNLLNTMPAWLKPSGVFGIGLQSVFQLTDCVEFYTRQHNISEWLISLYSYGKNRGKIVSWQLPENVEGIYYDNAVPGTNVKMVIRMKKFMEDGEVNKNNFKYYDSEFDSADPLDMVYAEVSQACEEKIKEFDYDYFNVYFDPKIIGKDGKPEEQPKSRSKSKLKSDSERRRLRKSYIYPNVERNDHIVFGESLASLQGIIGEGYSFIDNKAFFWDKTSKRCYCLTVRPCKIEEGELDFPEKVRSLYSICYKFNQISDADTIYTNSNPSKRLHAGFLNLDVLILDDQPMNYMNIDRDRLRDGAIDEEELLGIRREILVHWCEYFCGTGTGKNGDVVEEKGHKGRFDNMPGVLFSLILVFYQNVPSDLFKRFIKRYQGMVEDMALTLKHEEIPVTELWNEDNLFRVGLPLPDALKMRKDDIKIESAIPMKRETICRFPHRLVHIEKIQKEGGMLWYYFRLKMSGEDTGGVEMSDNARLHDYMCVFEPFGKKMLNVEFDSLIKKVFKPDQEYPDLIIPHSPHTFSKGRNMETDLDYCLRGYILSPFDLATTKSFREMLERGNGTVDELVNCVMSGQQLSKCVSYIMKVKCVKEEEKEAREKDMQEQYKRFLKNFFRIIVDNEDIVRNQFKEK